MVSGDTAHGLETIRVKLVVNVTINSGFKSVVCFVIDYVAGFTALCLGMSIAFYRC